MSFLKKLFIALSMSNIFIISNNTQFSPHISGSTNFVKMLYILTTMRTSSMVAGIISVYCNKNVNINVFCCFLVLFPNK